MALLVILGAIWLTAPWWYTDVEVSGVSVGFVRGGIEILWQKGSMDHQPGGWRVETWSQWVWWRWWFANESYSGKRYSSGAIFIPLWLPALLLGGVLFWVAQFEGRARRAQMSEVRT